MKEARPLASLPGPPPLPILGWRGNVLRFFADPIRYMTPLRERYGDLVAFTAGGAGPVIAREASPMSSVFALGPACNQAVYTQMGVFHSTRISGPPESRSFHTLTSGLFSMNDDRHRTQRRLIQPAFHKKRLDGYRDTMAAFTGDLLDRMRPGEARDVCLDMQALTLSIANRTLFGLTPSPGVLSLGEQIQDVVRRSMSPASLVPLNLPMSPRRRLIEAAARTEEGLRAVIASARRSPAGGDDILSTLLATRDEDGAELSEDELIGQLFLLFFAGHDTTKNAIAWTLFLLSQHPTIARDVVDELESVLRGDPPSVDQLGALPLIERVIKESLRLFTPAPFTGRITATSAVLGGHEIPAGTEIFVSPYCTHRDPSIYPAPLRFDPRRWETRSPSPHEYVPFGAGARMCIGAGFAMMEIKIVLSMLLQRFTFELPPGARVDRRTDIVLAPKHGLPMIVRARGAGVAAGRVRGDVREMVELPA